MKFQLEEALLPMSIIVNMNQARIYLLMEVMDHGWHESMNTNQCIVEPIENQ